MSPICREAPHGGMCIKFCMKGHLSDVINRAKFYLNRFCGGSNFWILHKKEKLPLTQGLKCHSACDGYDKLGLCSVRYFIKIHELQTDLGVLKLGAAYFWTRLSSAWQQHSAIITVFLVCLSVCSLSAYLWSVVLRQQSPKFWAVRKSFPC